MLFLLERMIIKMKKLFFSVFFCFVLITLITSPINASLFDWFLKSSKNTLKQDFKRESNIERNAIRGAEWEKNAERIICSQKNSLCVYSLEQIMNKEKISGTIKYTIVGEETTKIFINKNNLFKDTYFTKKPDFLEVTQTNGKISGIKILDAKTSPEAVRTSQNTAFNKLMPFGQLR